MPKKRTLLPSEAPYASLYGQRIWVRPGVLVINEKGLTSTYERPRRVKIIGWTAENGCLMLHWKGGMDRGPLKAALGDLTSPYPGRPLN